jgi:hypothetical protein
LLRIARDSELDAALATVLPSAAPVEPAVQEETLGQILVHGGGLLRDAIGHAVQPQHAAAEAGACAT